MRKPPLARFWRLIRSGRLRLRDVPLLVRMLYLVGKLYVLLPRYSLPRLIAAFDAPSSGRSRRTTSLRQLVFLVDRLMRFVYHDRYCMKRSLLFFHFMRRWGYDVQIHFGVMKSASELTGHAWVEIDGRPFAESSDPRQTFTRTYSFPPAPDDHTAAAAPNLSPFRSAEIA